MPVFHVCAYRVILAQLEGSGRGALAAYNQEQYSTLFSHLQDTPVSDPDQWLEQLMRKDKALGKSSRLLPVSYSIASVCHILLLCSIALIGLGTLLLAPAFSLGSE